MTSKVRDSWMLNDTPKLSHLGSWMSSLEAVSVILPVLVNHVLHSPFYFHWKDKHSSFFAHIPILFFQCATNLVDKDEQNISHNIRG